MSTFDPVIFTVFGVSARWYGLMYVVGFFITMLVANKQAARPGSLFDKDQVADLMFYGFIGAVVGGRVGYVLFYQWAYFLEAPLYLFKIWSGGMSFHGGLLGVALAFCWAGRRMGRSFLAVCDFATPLMPLALGAGRIGNFINGELWGKPTDLPWAMVFPDGGPLPRHPTQLYEFFFEGLILFIIMLWFSQKSRPTGQVSGLFLLLYGVMRLLIEFLREPDAHLGLLFGFITMGQLLSLPMIIIGFWLFYRPSLKQYSGQHLEDDSGKK